MTILCFANPETQLALEYYIVVKEKIHMQAGDHIYCKRLIIAYTHHGVYVGNNLVVHYQDGIIQRDSLDDFANGDKIHVMSRKKGDVSRHKSVKRALNSVGKKDYNLIWRNCETFARWCCENKAESKQTGIFTFKDTKKRGGNTF